MRDERQPIFLIGAGRSGTKFLRACLSASSEVDSIPYDINYVWRYGNETIPHDELTVNEIDDAIRGHIRNALPKLVSINKSNAKFFIEKSVPNTLRVQFLKELFPEAKFIHLIRDGRAVIESSVRQWQNPVSKTYLFKKLKYFPWRNYRYAFWFVGNMLKSKITKEPASWGPRYKGIEDDLVTLTVEEICAKQWSVCVESAESDLAKLDAEQVYLTRFEDLMNDSKKIMDLCEFIGLTDKSQVLNYFEKHVIRDNNQKSLQSLSPQTQDAIDKFALPTLQKLGYM